MLTECKECGQRVSDKAEACPSCGNPIQGKKPLPPKPEKKKKKVGCGIWCLSILLLFFLISLILPDRGDIGKEEPSITKIPSPKKELTRTDKIEQQFSAWDGSHYELENYIKAHMHDPDSYEHINTKYIDTQNYIVIITKFRGKNKFGAKIINEVIAHVDINGKIIRIVSD